MLDLVDTHCHLHFEQYQADAEAVLERSIASGVTRIITVGTNAADSQKAIHFTTQHEAVWASVGLHPHDAKHFIQDADRLASLIKQPKVVAVGECGLDYFYNLSPKADQLKALRWQIELAVEHNLPLIFHIRDAYDDFWPIVDDYREVKAVAHCFAAGRQELSEVLKRGWFVGLNGIATFTKDPEQLAAFKSVPLNKLLLETDAPFLTPTPLRGKINEPKNVVVIAEFLSQLRGEALSELATASTNNAHQLFGI